MKKRIFVSIYYLHLGGAETSLIGLLNALDKEKYDIDLFVFHHVGEMMQYIPNGINLLPEEPSYAHMDGGIKQCIQDGYWRIAFKRIVAQFKFGKYASRNHLFDKLGVYTYIAREVCPILPSLEKYGEYDLAISYIIPHQMVLDKVKAKKKICWLHTDYTKIGVDPEAELNVWRQYDYISSISPDVTKSFLQIFPSQKDKIIEIENIMPRDMIRSRANEFEVDWDAEAGLVANSNLVGEANNTLRILSIGRFSEQKNFDNLPDIARRIIASGCDIKWYIIGYGGDEHLIRQKIAEAGMQEHVIVLGKRTNPYPYIKACDIYVQPSRYEGKSITVREAQMLCKPVAVTNYPTASSQIQDGADGVIVPLNNEGCAKGIANFILDSERQKRIIDYLKSHDFAKMEEASKIYKLI